MSAIIKLVNHLPSQPPIPESLEDQFDNINSPETPLEHKLACALACILNLQRKVNDVQSELRRVERDLSIKDMLLRNAALRERELRRQAAGRAQ